MTVNANNPEYAGNHTIDVIFAMTRYPTITLQLSFMLRLFVLFSPPDIVNQTYQVNNPILLVNSDLFTYAPISADMILTHTVTMLDGSTLPDFIKYSISDEDIQFQFFSQTASDVGIIMIKISANLAAVTGTGVNITEIKTLQIQIIAASANITVNKLPYFVQNLTSSFDVVVGETWSYTLPDVFDLEDLGVQVTASLGQAVTFMKFKNNTLSIGVTDQSQINTYIITLTVTDSQGGFSTSHIRFNLKPFVIIKNTTIYNETFVGYQLQQIIGKVNVSQTALKAFYLNLQESIEWGQLFAKAIIQGIGKNQKPPTAKITAISRDGIVVVTFDQEIVVSSLDIIQNSTINIDGKILPAVELLIKPGYYSNKTNLNFTYNITGYHSRGLKFQIYFEQPLIVSSLEDPDLLEVKFNGYQYFFNQYGITIKPETVIQRIVPRQMVQDSVSKFMAEQAKTAGFTTVIILITNLILNIILSASLQQLWSMINTQQIIVLMPLFSVNLPANAAIFFGFMMQIASFNLIPTDLFYNEYLQMTDNHAINDNFDQIGFSSQYFLYDIGDMIIAILLLPVMGILILLMKVLHCEIKWILYQRRRLTQHLFWGHPITILQESYIILVFSCLLNMENVSFQNQCFQYNFITVGDKISTVCSFLVFALSILLPIVLCCVLLSKFDYLQRKPIKRKWGVLYSNLNIKKGRWIILHILHYFFRRMMLCVIIICQSSLILQIYMTFFSFITSIIILGFIDPYKDPSDLKKEYFNEIVIMLVLYCLMCFTDIVPGMIIQYYIGWVCCVIVCLHLLYNLLLMLIALTNRLKLFYLRFKFRKQNKKKIQTDEVTKKELQQQRDQRKALVDSISASNDIEKQRTPKKINEEQEDKILTNEKQEINPSGSLGKQLVIQNPSERRLIETEIENKIDFRNLDYLLEDLPQSNSQFIAQSLNFRKMNNIISQEEQELQKDEFNRKTIPHFKKLEYDEFKTDNFQTKIQQDRFKKLDEEYDEFKARFAQTKVK